MVSKARPIAWDVDSNGCWICTSHMLDKCGRFIIKRDGKKMPLHKMLFEKHKYKVPEGYTVNNTCGNNLCSNPDHLTADPMNFKTRQEIQWEVDSNGCWNITSHKPLRSGYVQLNRGEDRGLAHRVHYVKYKGEIPKGLIVRHTCDNRLCINPDHLIVGTYKDNMQDAIDRNRNQYGERHAKAKLKEVDVINIRTSKESTRALATKYNMGYGYIWRVRKGEFWSRVVVPK